MVSRMDARLILAVLAFGAGQALAQGFDHSHKAWDELLRKHVVLISGGKASQLDYAGMARDRAALKAYLEALSQVSEGQFGGWTGAQRMAYLINAYNAGTAEKILTRYPAIKSIWDFGRLFGNPFKDEFFVLFGNKSSLDRIEHEMLRKPGAYDEPRERHFAKYAKLLADGPEQQRAIAEGRAPLAFLDYDWSLNDSPSSSRR